MQAYFLLILRPQNQNWTPSINDNRNFFLLRLNKSETQSFFLKQLQERSTSWTVTRKYIYRSSHRRCSIKEMFLGLRPANLFKKRLWHRRSHVNVANFLRIPFLQNTSGQLVHYKSEKSHFRG